MDEILSTVNAEPVSTVETQPVQDTSQNETVNAVQEDTAQPQNSKPVQTAEENAHFAEQRRAREAAESKAATLERDYGISKQYGAEWGVHSEGDIAEKYGHLGINTLSEFQEAVRIEEMKSNGVDVDQYEKYKNEDPDVKAAREWKEKHQQEEKSKAEYKDFFDLYKELNGRDFTTDDTIPQEVWDLTAKGKSLDDAYARYHAKELKTKLSANETNKRNEGSSPGSISGNNSTDTGTISRETFEANKHDQRWVINNLSKIQDSRTKW